MYGIHWEMNNQVSMWILDHKQEKSHGNNTQTHVN